MSTQPLLLKVHEAASILGISRSHTYALLREKVLPSFRMGSSVRVPRAALEAWIQKGTEDACDPRERESKPSIADRRPVRTIRHRRRSIGARARLLR